jgi:hypothetical protein
MRRMVGQPGSSVGLFDGDEIRKLLDQMDGPEDVGRSNVLFERVMAKLAEDERRHRRLRQIGQLARAAVAAIMTGAGAYRLLTR